MSKSPPIIFWSLVTCNLAMMVLAIGVNLLPVFLTTLASDLGRGAPLSAEQLGRIGAVTFCGVVGESWSPGRWRIAGAPEFSQLEGMC